MEMRKRSSAGPALKALHDVEGQLRLLGVNEGLMSSLKLQGSTLTLPVSSRPVLPWRKRRAAKALKQAETRWATTRG